MNEGNQPNLTATSTMIAFCVLNATTAQVPNWKLIFLFLLVTLQFIYKMSPIAFAKS